MTSRCLTSWAISLLLGSTHLAWSVWDVALYKYLSFPLTSINFTDWQPQSLDRRDCFRINSPLSYTIHRWPIRLWLYGIISGWWYFPATHQLTGAMFWFVAQCLFPNNTSVRQQIEELYKAFNAAGGVHWRSPVPNRGHSCISCAVGEQWSQQFRWTKQWLVPTQVHFDLVHQEAISCGMPLSVYYRPYSLSEALDLWSCLLSECTPLLPCSTEGSENTTNFGFCNLSRQKLTRLAVACIQDIDLARKSNQVSTKGPQSWISCLTSAPILLSAPSERTSSTRSNDQ